MGNDIQTPLYFVIFSLQEFSCMKLKISITTKSIWFSNLNKLQIGPVRILGCSIFRFKSWDGLKLFLSLSVPSFTEHLDTRGVAAWKYIIYYLVTNHMLNAEVKFLSTKDPWDGYSLEEYTPEQRHTAGCVEVH